MVTLLNVGLSNAVMAGALALLAAAAGRVCRRPALVHSLWLLVLLKLLTPPLVPLNVPLGGRWLASDASAAPTRRAVAYEHTDARERPAIARSTIVPLAQTESQTVGVGEPARANAVVQIVIGAIRAEDIRTQPAGLLERSPNASAVSVAVGGSEKPASAGTWRSGIATLALARLPSLVRGLRLAPWRSLAASMWVAGSAAWLLLASVRIVRFGRLLRHARSAPEELQTMADELARELGLARSPAVWLVPGCVSPLLWAVGGAPRLLVPQALWEQLDDDQQAALLVHELAHLRRRDHWVRRLELVVTGLYWWHPAVWWARRGLREAEEQCCDAWVVWALPASARSYATALLQTLDFLSQARPCVPLAASGAGHLSCLKRRLTMIMQETTPRALSWAGRLAMFSLAAVLLPVAPTRGQGAGPAAGAAPSVSVTTGGPAGSAAPAGAPGAANVISTTPAVDDADSQRQAQLAKARKEVQDLSEQLGKLQEQFIKAQRRLAELGGGNEPITKLVPVVIEGQSGPNGAIVQGLRYVRADNGRIISATPVGVPNTTPPVATVVATNAPSTESAPSSAAPAYTSIPIGAPSAGAGANGQFHVVRTVPDVQNRLTELERKLDKVIDELAKLKGQPAANVDSGTTIHSAK